MRLDLTGLPPTISEIEAFLADNSPIAYEKVVDRLLRSPEYGEKQARLWLDLARFADSDGYEKDLNRTAWKYRDWVIQAFNSNMPYDQFTVEQLAGDLLPKPSMDQLVATGFNRNTMLNLEGGVDQADAHFMVVNDRVATTSTVWMGSTLGCARCHDHKYDPFSIKDYYSMAGFFSNAKIYPRGDANVGEEKWYEKQIQVLAPEDQKRLDDIVARQNAAVARLKAEPTPEWREAVSKGISWTPLDVHRVSTANGSVLQAKPDGSYLTVGKIPNQDNYTLSGETKLESISAIKIEALPDPGLTLKGPGTSTSGNFLLTGVHLRVDGVEVPLVEGSATYAQNPYSVDRKLSAGGYSWAVYPQQGKQHDLVLEAEKSIPVAAGATVEVVLEQQNTNWPQHLLGRFRLSFTSAKYPRVAVLPVNASAKDQAIYYARTAPELRSARFDVTDLVAEKAKIQSRMATALVMEDKPVSGEITTHVHPRGEFLQLGEVVRANVPAFLPSMPANAPKNRLGLAKWIVDRQNPLTARVQVNRMWETLFGRGLVDTSEDFGTQGSRPSHPELLDWLAVDFMEHGWNVKAMFRQMVLSSTYRQSSQSTLEMNQRDPLNTLLSRGPRFRLEAEAIRDTILSAAGMLDLTVGGPSVMPYQPAGVWDTPYNGESWNVAMGSQAYRRGIYTFWKRTSPYPSFMAFDAGSRESCLVRRTRTNTPLQALALLNDASMMEAAKGLAHRMSDWESKHNGPNTAGKIRYGFATCTSRYPTKVETDSVVKLLDKLEKEYVAHPSEAKKLSDGPRGAALVMVANVLLNLDETITKG